MNANELPVWLAQVDANLALGNRPLDVQTFTGTSNELDAVLARWQRPSTLRVFDVDLARVTLDAEHQAGAKLAVERELAAVAESGAIGIVVIRAAHILATLYPMGALRELNRYLRNGRLAALVIVPPMTPRPLPDGAFTADWRSHFSQSAGPVAARPTQPVTGDS